MRAVHVRVACGWWREGWWVVRVRACVHVLDVQEAVLVLVLVVQRRHVSSRRRQHIVHEDIDRLFCAQLDPLADNVHELTYCQVGGHEVLLLIDVGHVAFLGLLDDDLREASRTGPVGNGAKTDVDVPVSGPGICHECEQPRLSASLHADGSQTSQPPTHESKLLVMRRAIHAH